MQQIFNILGLIPGYLIVLAIFLVILPTFGAILLRYALYRHLKSLANKTKKLLIGIKLESTPTIINKLEQRFVDSKINLDRINTASVIEGAYSQERFYFLGLSLDCEFIDYFCRILPNLLLSFGLLGTFLGITFNLSNLSQTITQIDINDVRNLVEELNQPLQGMGVAFTTSLIAIACSSLLTVLNLLWNTNIIKAGLLSYLEDYIDNIYLPQVQPISSIEGAIEKFGSDFEQMLYQLSNTIEESMNKAFSRIENSGETFEKAANVLDNSGFPERLAAATNDLAIAQNQFSQSSLILQKSTQSFDHNLISMQKLTKKILELNQEKNAIERSGLKEIQQELSKLVNKIN
ncbi:methyl-accepting chemotaxis protein [Waterburya agarophytonicola K14]|uniref:Methyl-accepting chemotaxis protein n=1 Tax=Waterburya agarophytonicola KI4 TaxID=2874699 RepID=A0A964FL11_9CYAN|nr:methyl-accepting chemotaxis protein [Waterburya agarophytonicola]MCC0179534.1 methyl-accepting chemotaxis protein [Waterburya agarophytonicola KI4]